MKNKIQVKHYLSNKSFSTDLDYAMISSYCSQQFKIQIENIPPLNNRYSLTCAEFIDWMNSGMEAGTVVKYKDSVGILMNSTPKTARIYAQTDFKAPRFDFITVSIQDIQEAKESAANRLISLLRENGEEFNRLTLEITEKYVPKVDDIVMFSSVANPGSEKCYGIFRIIEDGNVIMYCYCDGNDDVHYSPDLHENIGKLEDYQFTKIESTSYGRKKLETLLNRRGMSWNHYVKRIESLDMRVAKGGTYYYINDKMAVVSAVDDGGANTAAARRYQAGNYSKVREKMMRCQMDVADVLKKYMAEPE